jgi:predicted nucleotide-binding protein
MEGSMRVFLSWSGKRSRELALALRDWLPAVIQAVEPWLSAEDIPMGQRWASEITERLQETDIGIICLTPENIDAEWLNFEAGALSKIASSFVCPYAINLRPSALKGPLSQFQVAIADKEGTFRLVQALNNAGDGPALSQSTLENVFDVWWPTLEQKLEEIKAKEEISAKVEASTIEQKIEELLLEVREMKSSINSHSQPSEKIDLPEEEIEKARPRVFIGSSAEGLSVAEAIHLGLDYVAECTIWNHGVFSPSQTAIESIIDASAAYDFAIIILSADDMIEKRGSQGIGPRDNMIFELGLFTGALGRARTFMVYCRDEELVLPSDLAGVTSVTYAKRSDDNLEAALGPVCSRIKKAMGVA